MENSENINAIERNSSVNSTADDYHEDNIWLNLTSIDADPPDRREKCEYCQWVQIESSEKNPILITITNCPLF